jgi:hypothetical protein
MMGNNLIGIGLVLLALIGAIAIIRAAMGLMT